MTTPVIRRWWAARWWASRWAARRDPDAVEARRRRRMYRAGARRDARARRWARARTAAGAVRRPVLLVAGLACLTAAVWLLHRGLAAAGVSLLLLEWLTGPERPPTPGRPRPPRRR